MASIQRLSGKPNWYCSLTFEDGKRTFRSTHIPCADKNRAEASSLCEQWQREIGIVRKAHSTETSPLKFENRQEVIEGLISATQKLVQGTFTTAHAQTMLNKILEAGNQAPLTQTSVEDFLNGWVESKAITKAKGTVVRYRHTIRTFLDHLGKRAKINLSSLSVKDFESFRDIQIRDGKSAQTSNMVLKTLRIPLNAARKRGLLLTNPSEAVELLPRDGVTRDVFSQPQLQALMEVADDDWRGMILIGYTVGARIGDAALMTWGNIDFENAAVRYSPQKTKSATSQKRLEAILMPELRDFLLSHSIGKDQPAAPLFPSLYSKAVSGDHGLSLTFRRLIDEAGIQYESLRGNVRGKGRNFYNLGYHSLRHTFISMMANLGVAEEIRRKIVGQSSADVHKIYTHLEQKTMVRALRKFPRLLPRDE